LSAAALPPRRSSPSGCRGVADAWADGGDGQKGGIERRFHAAVEFAIGRHFRPQPGVIRCARATGAQSLCGDDGGRAHLARLATHRARGG
jgi:hypothetical protein